MTERKIRWGILSTANIGRSAVVPAIRSSRNGTVTAVASRSAAAARTFAEALVIPRTHGSYQELLDDPEIDAVYIPLPNSLHHRWTIAAAERGKHVLCEKPLALDAAECLEMEAAARANGVQLMEAFMYRFHPRTERVVSLVREGALGVPTSIHAAFTFKLTKPDNIRLQPGLGGGALMDVGCYCVNVSRTLAGTEPVEVRAWAEWGPTGVDTRLAGSLRFPGDLIAQFDCALSVERREWYEVAGTDGAIAVPAAFLPGTGDARFDRHRGRAVDHETIAGADEYRLMVEHFGDAVLSGAPLRYPANEAAANMRVIGALYASARAGGIAVAVG